MYLVDSAVCRQGRFIQQAPELLQSCGTIIIAFLVCIVSLMTRHLQSFLHPNGVHTVTKYPTVLWGQGDHDKMLIIAAISLSMPISGVRYMLGCQAVSGPNHDRRSVLLALLALPLLPVPFKNLLMWPHFKLSQHGHGSWTSVARSVCSDCVSAVGARTLSQLDRGCTPLAGQDCKCD